MCIHPVTCGPHGATYSYEQWATQNYKLKYLRIFLYNQVYNSRVWALKMIMSQCQKAGNNSPDSYDLPTVPWLGLPVYLPSLWIYNLQFKLQFKITFNLKNYCKNYKVKIIVIIFYQLTYSPTVLLRTWAVHFLNTGICIVP